MHLCFLFSFYLRVSESLREIVFPFLVFLFLFAIFAFSAAKIFLFYPMLTTRIVDFPEIESAWRKMEADGDVPTIFQTFDWIETWWKHLSHRGKPLLIATFDNTSVIGIAPLFTTKMKIKGVSFFNMLLPMGSGESDYNGFILKKDRERDALNAILSFLKKQHWDIMRLGDVQAESPTAAFITDSCAAVRLPYTQSEHTPCPYIVLPHTVEEFATTLTTHFKKNLRNRSRKLAELGALHFTVSPHDIPVPEAMAAFFKLHENRWGEQGQKGALADPRVKSMHLEAAQRLERYFHTGFLELNGKRIACQYGYTYNNNRYSYLRGWDPEYKKMGVANVLLMDLIEKAISMRIKEYDFMRGDEGYKFEFTGTVRKNSSIVIGKNVMMNWLYCCVERLAR